MGNGTTVTRESSGPLGGFDIASLVHNLPGMAYRCRWNGTWLMEFVSDGCRRVTGYEPLEILGQAGGGWHPLLHPDDLRVVAPHISRVGEGNPDFQVVYRIFTKDGAERWLMEDGLVVSMPGDEAVYLEGFISDITDRKQTEMSLREANRTIGRLMREDPLTGLANRRALEENLPRAVSFARRWKHPLSVVMADLDHFKTVNDRYGHLAGDQVLVSFSQLLKNACRVEDIVARFGGEEFVLLLPNTSLQQAAKLAERLRLDTTEATMPIPVPITSSFGVTCFEAYDTEDSLIARADRALYQAKANGRNCVRTLEADGTEPAWAGETVSLTSSELPHQ